MIKGYWALWGYKGGESYKHSQALQLPFVSIPEPQTSTLEPRFVYRTFKDVGCGRHTETALWCS